METDVSVRDLRNHTARVLDDVEAGSTVYITRNGERVAALTSLATARHPANARLLAYLDATEAYDSGLMDEVLESRQADRAATEARQHRIGLL